jgi:hypothetical protein
MMEVLQDLVLTCLQTGVDDKKQTSRQGSRGSSQGKGRKVKILTLMMSTED